MEKEKIKLKEIWVGNWNEKIDNTIRYIHENAAGVSLVVTAVISIASTSIKFLYYLMDFGYVSYFKIPKTMIDVSKENLLYSFFVDGIIALGLLFICSIPYFIWCSKKKTINKVLWSGFIIIIPDLFLLVGLVLDILNGIRYPLIYTLKIFSIGLFLSALFFGLSFYYGIKKHCLNNKKENKKNKDKKNKDKKNKDKKNKDKKNKDKKNKDKNPLTESQKIKGVCLSIIMLIVLESGVFFFIGYSNANAKDDFKIITTVDGEKETTYAVFYEVSNTYIMTECKLEENTISFVDLEVKYEIKRDVVEYKIVNAIQK